MTLAGLARFICATAIIWIVGGFGTWLIGNVGHASGVARPTTSARPGLIFGWLAFLLVFGFFTRTIWEIVVGVVVLFVYGSVLLGALPGWTAAAGCPGRAICAARSPACSRPTCCPGRNARRGNAKKAGQRPA